MRKANTKEIYTACLILLIGSIYLAAQAGAWFAIGSTTIRGDVIQLSKNEMLSHLRTIITIILCLTGGILLLKGKKAGWIISLSILFLLLTIASGIFVSNIGGLNTSAGVLIFGICLILLGIIFLIHRQTRQRFMISSKTYVPVVVLFAALAIFYFFLQ